MEDYSHALDIEDGLILKVLGVDLCARAILDYVPLSDLVRSERVCKWWQRVVQNYLRSCHTLCLCDMNCHKFTFNNPNIIATGSDTHRRIKISADDSFLLAYGIVEKFGSSITKVVTERSNDEYFEIIASQCPHLQEIVVGVTDAFELPQFNLIKKFKQMKRIKIRYLNGSEPFETDEALGKLFQNIACETIKLKFETYSDLTGSFLQSIDSSNLKSLSITQSSCLDISNFLSAMPALRNVTSLILNGNGFSLNRNVHLLLVEMPQLEELSLSEYPKRIAEQLKKESIRAFSGLVNLKRLTLRRNYIVTDALLEALARGCRKLEYLNIRNCPLAARGLAALCRRSPSAVTTFLFGYIKDEKYDEEFKARVDNPLLPELASLCCLDMTPQWWESMCRASRGRMHPVELSSNCNSVHHRDPRHKLKIMLDIIDIDISCACPNQKGPYFPRYLIENL